MIANKTDKKASDIFLWCLYDDRRQVSTHPDLIVSLSHIHTTQRTSKDFRFHSKLNKRHWRIYWIVSRVERKPILCIFQYFSCKKLSSSETLKTKIIRFVDRQDVGCSITKQKRLRVVRRRDWMMSMLFGYT